MKKSILFVLIILSVGNLFAQSRKNLRPRRQLPRLHLLN